MFEGHIDPRVGSEFWTDYSGRITSRVGRNWSGQNYDSWLNAYAVQAPLIFNFKNRENHENAMTFTELIADTQEFILCHKLIFQLIKS